MATRSSDRRERFSDQAHAAVRAMIVRAELPPGSRLSEAALTERLGIGRTPLREALLRLADEGLIDVYPQSGRFVAPIRVEAVTEGQFVREHLECAVIRELAVLIDGAAVPRLRKMLGEQELALRAADHERFFVLDEALHAQFAELAGRAGVWRIIQQSKTELDRVRVLSLPMADQIPRLIEQHRAIVDALAARDPALAEAALRLHLREVYATIERLGLNRIAADAVPDRRPIRISRR